MDELAEEMLSNAVSLFLIQIGTARREFHRNWGSDRSANPVARCSNLRVTTMIRKTSTLVRSPAEPSARSEEPPCLDYRAIGERIAHRLAQQYPELTARERVVCGYTLAGYTAEAISLILGIGVSTIITYRRRAYSRLGVSNATQMIAPLLVEPSPG